MVGRLHSLWERPTFTRELLNFRKGKLLFPLGSFFTLVTITIGRVRFRCTDLPSSFAHFKTFRKIGPRGGAKEVVPNITIEDTFYL